MHIFLIYGAIVFFLFILVMIWPSAALGAVLGMYGLDQWSMAQSAFFYEHHALTNILMGVIVLVALLRRFFWTGQESYWRYPLNGWLTISLLAFAALSITWSQYPDLTEKIYKQKLPYLITIVLLMPLTIISLKDVQRALFAVLAIGTVLVPLLLLTTHWNGRHVETMYGGINGGQNPLETASLGARIFLLLLLMNFKGWGRLFQVVRWVLGGFAVVLVIHSGSRGQFIGMFLLAVALLPFSRSLISFKQVFSTVVGLAIAVALMVTLLIHFGNVSDRWNLSFTHVQNAYLSSRGTMILTVLAYWLNAGPFYWLVGIGNSVCYASSVNGIYPHCVPVQVLVEEGIVGLALLLLILWFTARSALRIYRVCKPFDDARGVAVAFMALFLFDLILSLKEGSMLGSPNLFASAIILGRVELSVRQRRATQSGVPVAGTGTALPYIQT